MQLGLITGKKSKALIAPKVILHPVRDLKAKN